MLLHTFYLNESLTPMNSYLMKETRKLTKPLKYKYPAYTVKGEVRCKKIDNSKYIKIRNINDLKKIV